MANRSPRIRVLSVDDHPLLRAGIAALIANQPDLELIGEAANGQEAIEQFHVLRPDITLMDLQMPDMGGIEVIAAIRGEFPDARIVVLTTFAGDVLAQRALKAGAQAYVLKNAVRKELLDVIRAVHRGQKRIQAEVAVELATHTGEPLLTPRELQVLELVSAGNSNKRAAGLLGIDEETVKGHVASILAKLGARDRTHAVTVALKRGIFQL
jgi:two-component system, NarL family, response regulator